MEVPAPQVRDVREAARSEKVLKGRAPVRIPLAPGQHPSLESLEAVLDGFRGDILGQRAPLQLLPPGDPEPSPAAAVINGARPDGPLEVGKCSRNEATGKLLPRVPGVPRFHDRIEQFARGQADDVTRPQGWRQVGRLDGAENSAHTPNLSGRTSFLTCSLSMFGSWAASRSRSSSRLLLSDARRYRTG